MEIVGLWAVPAVLLAGLVYVILPRIYEQRAEWMLRKGRDRAAARLLEHAWRLWQRRRGAASLDAAVAQAALAHVRFVQERRAEGVQLLTESAQLVFSADCRPNQRLLQALRYLGMAAHAAGRHDEAVAIFEKALPLARRLYGGLDPRLAEIERRLGDARAAGGDFEEAYECYDRALEILRLESGGDDDGPETALVLASVAAAMTQEERWAEAQDTGLMAADILDHKDQALLPEALHALAELHARRGKLIEAEGLRLSICHLWERVAGPDSAVVAREYERRAELLQRMRRTSEADLLLRKASAIRGATLAEGGLSQ